MDRIKKAKEYGFDAIEFWGWKEGTYFSEKDIKKTKEECKKNQIAVSHFTANWERSMLDPSDKEGCIRAIKESINVAIELNCHNLLVLPNVVMH